MTALNLERPNGECQSLVNRLSSGFYTTCALLPLVLVLALVVLRFGRPTSFEGIGYWIRVCRLRFALREVYHDAPPTLDQLRALPPLPRIAGLTEFCDSYAKDGPGALYVTAVAANCAWQNFFSGLITADEFLAELRVKVGHAHNLPVRRGKYRRCDVGQTHFWLYCFYPKKRIVAEQMCHLCFLDADTPRAILDCVGRGKKHKEYWWLRDLGGFAKVEERVRGVLALLGQPDLPRVLGGLDFQSCSILTNHENDEMYIDSYHVRYEGGGHLRSRVDGRGVIYVAQAYCKEMVTLKVDDPVHGCTCGCSQRSTLGCTPGSC
ncbi:hypothetical protein C8F04DRAFT_1189225 [Mycena alexandri]|uniref:Uncharacterized protein n=1 Tax=Mycena alexandri TaxID=1745969 RepID=A0AAD6WX20_9AGAR|nr:hypothetical protein C8F04DRAFT_1189225 [Mycena alexandri]